MRKIPAKRCQAYDDYLLTIKSQCLTILFEKQLASLSHFFSRKFLSRKMKNEKDEVFDGIHGHINELDDFLYRHFDELEKLKV